MGNSSTSFSIIFDNFIELILFLFRWRLSFICGLILIHCFIALKLPRNKLFVNTIFDSQKFIVAANLFNFTIFDNDDLVGISNGGKSMCNDDDCEKSFLNKLI